MWIRNQQRDVLVECSKIECVYVNDKASFIVSNRVTLAIYPTKERCLEVLDEIQAKLLDSNLSSNEGIARNVIPQLVVYEMPKE